MDMQWKVRSSLWRLWQWRLLQHSLAGYGHQHTNVHVYSEFCVSTSQCLLDAHMAWRSMRCQYSERKILNCDYNACKCCQMICRA